MKLLVNSRVNQTTSLTKITAKIRKAVARATKARETRANSRAIAALNTKIVRAGEIGKETMRVEYSGDESKRDALCSHLDKLGLDYEVTEWEGRNHFYIKVYFLGKEAA